MDRDKPDISTLSLEALAVFRGIYKRVAVQLDVDPSYVSRVARGERNAPFISEALRKEIHRVLGKAGLHNGNGNHSNHNGRGQNHDGHGNHNGDGKPHDNSHRTLAALFDGNHANGHGRNGHSGDPQSGKRRSSFSDGNAATRAKQATVRKKKPQASSRRKS